MNTIPVSLAFTRGPDSELLIKAQEFVQRLTGNPSFPNPQPPISVVEAQIELFKAALAASADGGREKTAHKNDAREVLVDSLRSWARYVEVQSQGDLTKLISSGFTPHKERQRAGVLPAPSEVLLKATAIPGQIALRTRPVTNAAAYQVHSNTDPALETGWIDRGTFTSSRMTLEELTPGSLCWIRVRSLGTAGPGAWSGPVSVRVG